MTQYDLDDDSELNLPFSWEGNQNEFINGVEVYTWHLRYDEDLKECYERHGKKVAINP